MTAADRIAVDSARWTGRTWQSRITLYLGRLGLAVLFSWRDRDLPEGEVGYHYGIVVGHDPLIWRSGIFFHWDRRRWALVWRSP